MADGVGVGGLIVGAIVKGATNGLVTKYFDKVISPFVRGAENSKLESTIRKRIFRYIKNIEYRTRYLPSIAIPSGVYVLEDVYQPLTLRSEADGATFLVDAYPGDVFANSRCVSITDEAGMGKSTLAKFIVRSALNEDKKIPLLIELRRLRDDVGILDAICLDLAGGDANSAAGEALTDLLAQGNFMFILDGYDELEDDLRVGITDEINNLAARFQFCYFVLTSRKEYGSALFGEFAQFDICELSLEQAHELIRRYDAGRGRAKGLIAKLAEADVSEFLGNPLLVTLLYKAFDYRPTIPPKRSTFYRQVYEALFQDHDLSKGGWSDRKRLSGLDIDDFHKFLRALGFLTYKSGRLLYSPEEFCHHLSNAVDRSMLDVEWQKLKSDLIRAVPVFVKEGPDYRWSHKSLQEYFAANYIVSDLAGRSGEAVSRLFNSEDVIKYQEVLKFIAEADISMVRSECFEPLISSYRGQGGGALMAGYQLWLDSIDLFYLGGLQGKSQSRAEVLELLESEFGFTPGDRLSHLVFDRSHRNVIYMSLTSVGKKAVLLGWLDPELFPAKRSDVTSSLRFLRGRFSDARVHVNSALRETDGDALARLFEVASAVTHVPIVTNGVVDYLAAVKERRSAVAVVDELEGF